MIADTVSIRKASNVDVDRIAPLFDAYRQFYGKAPDLALAERFLRERLERRESTIFVAERGSASVGFVQLYPSFSSGAAAPIVILNDLYVMPEARRAGVGRWLIGAALNHAKSVGAVRVTLATGVENQGAKALYELAGFRPDADFHVYHCAVGK